jgi:uncharacterized protein (TIGR03083 family)
MQPPSQAQYFGEIRTSAATMAQIAGSCDNELPVPSCPDWTLRQLATHLGRVHRWVGEIVRTRSQEAIPMRAAPDGIYPGDPAGRAAWLIAGAGRLIDALADAGEEPLWAFGAGVPASFWARRQAQETMMHRADAELAAGRPVLLDQQLAADGIDEWLSMLARGAGGNGSGPLPAGQRLRLTAAVAGDPDAASWLVTGTADGVIVDRGDTLDRAAGQADVAVSGPADRLLLVLVRRVSAADPAVSVAGAGALFGGWLAGTPF